MQHDDERCLHFGDGPGRCQASQLPGVADRCLAHARQEDRSRYYESVREGSAELSDGQLAGLQVGAELAGELRELLLQVPRRAVDFQNSTFDSDLDLSGVHLGPARFGACRFEANALFDETVFGGNVTFANAEMGIDGHRLSFRGAQFESDVDFAEAKVSGNAEFAEAKFSGDDTGFSGVEFQNDVSFEDAEFGGKVVFSGATFGRPGRISNFRKSVFKREVAFVNTIFNGRALFGDVTFAHDVGFQSAQFRELTIFADASFGGDADFVATRFDTADAPTFFNNARFKGEVSFAAATFADLASFSGARFEGWPPVFVSANFQEVYFDFIVDPAEPVGARPLDLSRAVFPNDVSFGPQLFRATVNDDRLVVNISDARAGGNLSFDKDSPNIAIILDSIVLTNPVTVVTPRGGRVSLEGITLTHPLTLTTPPDLLDPSEDDSAQVTSLQNATLEAPLVVGNGMALTNCDLLGATGLDNLRITVVDPRWDEYRHRRVIAEERAYRKAAASGDASMGPHPRQVEAIYRQLRAALETSKAAPAAADFYYGEMEMRRLSSRRLSFDRVLLSVYRLTSGYGLRAYRALVSYLILLLATTLLLRFKTDWFVADRTAVADSTSLSFTSSWDVFAIAARSSVSFLSTATSGLTATGTLLFIILRLAGPATVALTIFALRARVQR